jgi:integrase
MAVYRRGDRSGKWMFAFDVERGPGEKRQQVRKTGFRTKKEAEAAERQVRAEHDQGVRINEADISLATFFDQWLSAYAPNRLKPSTAERYEQLARLYIKPAIGKLTMRQIRPYHIELCCQEVTAQGRSSTTALRVYSLLHLVLRQAVRKWQLLPRNPAEAVERPKAPKPQTTTPNLMELAKLLQLGDTNPLGMIFRFAALTGMRRGEVLALRWSDVDFVAGTVSVRGSVRRLSKGRGMIRMTPKRDTSVRQLELSGEVSELLKEQRRRQLQEKMRERLDYVDEGVVFANPLGGYRDPDHITRTWKKLARSAGLGDIRLHDLRHSLATRLLELGVEAKVVQEILGHSSYSTTMNIYSHVSRSLQADAMKRVGQLIGGAAQ